MRSVLDSQSILMLIGAAWVGGVLPLTAASNSGESTVFNTTDLADKTAQTYVKDWTDETFGLSPYRPNYLLLFGYTGYDYVTYIPDDGTYKHYEAELQISFKFALAKNLLGLGEKYYAAYTQRSFWQIYKPSSPFRETNYNPELFVTIPMSTHEEFGPKMLELGYAHLSNGQGNINKTGDPSRYPEFVNRSRSLNRLYGKLTFQHQSLVWSIKAWYPFGNYADDNPDIMDFMGYGSLSAMYFHGKHLVTAMVRGNPATQKGALEMTYSHPGKVKGVYLFGKLFTGYGESLIDYNHNITKVSVGFSFSR